MSAERLQKILARGGVASRRACEEIIQAGRVRVNGKIVTELGAVADTRRDKIELDGKLVLRESFVYAVLQKPRGYMSTLSDPEGRPTIVELLKKLDGRVFPVGRLDFATSGVLLITNDGEFSNALTHPSRKVPKTYVVKVQGEMTERDMEQWRKGIQLEDGVTQPAELVFDRYEDKKTWFELTIFEGRNQQIRRMGEATGFEVMRLSRLSFAGITGEKLKPGAVRHLSYRELVDLKKVFGVPRKTAPSGLDIEDAKALKKPVKLRSNRDNPNAGIESRDTNRFAAEREAKEAASPRARGPRPGAKNAYGGAAEARGGRSDRGAPAPAAPRGGRSDRAPVATRAPRAAGERSARGGAAPAAPRGGRSDRAPVETRTPRAAGERSSAPAPRARPLYRGGAKKDDTAYREERVPAMPRAARSEAPRSGRSEAPRGGRSEAPRGARSEAPRGARSEAPRGARSEAPRGARSEAPRGARSEAPRGGRGEAPRGGRSEAPRGGRSEAPRGGRSEAPRGGRSEAPRGGRGDAPRGGRSDAPRGGRSEAPRGARSDAPRGGRSEAPRGGRSDAPAKPRRR